MLITGGTVAGDVLNPAPAEALVHNLMPSHADGLPDNRFRANEALYATFTSDFFGGWICVVDVGVTNASAASCESPAWGSPNFYVGIGTQLGMPLEAPLLPVGEWRLLGGHPQTKQGTVLSAPFTVLPCTGTCDTSGATAELQAWKDRAAAQSSGYGALCLGLNVKSLVGAANAARGVYSFIGGGLGGLAFGLAGGAFTYFVPTSTEALAWTLLKDLSCGVRTMYVGIAEDPPDPNFDTIAPPEFLFGEDRMGGLGPEFDPVLDAHGALLNAYDAAAAYGTASRIAYERYQGALIADPPDLTAAAAQAEATAHFTREAVKAMRDIERLQPALESSALTQGPIASAEDFAAAMAERERVRTQGHTAAELEQLANLITPESLARLEASYEPVLLDGASTESIPDPSVSLSSLLAETRAELASTITAFDEFGRVLSVEASELRKQADVNNPPVAAFSVSATSGTAPLTVTFTSEATDPDGDALTLEWDIAGIATRTGPVVSYTFTQPGTYGISLVATDPGGLRHQSIQTITVAPPDAPPNAAPVASFTQAETPGSAPLEVTFTSTSSDPDGDDLTHTWYFGDGETLTGEVVTRTFAPGFIYSVVLVVSDGVASSSAAGEVVAGNPPPNQAPVSSFTADVTDGVAPLAVTLTSTASDPDGDDLTLTWYLGDGTAVTGESTVTHTYGAPGTYAVVLHAQDSHGAWHTSERTITVKAVADPDVPEELTAAFTAGKGFDAAQAGTGARVIVASSVHTSNSYSPANILVPNTSEYRTAPGAAADQEVLVELGGEGPQVIDRVLLQPPNHNNALGEFTVSLSRSGFAPEDFATVVSGTLAAGSAAQEFTFDAQPARYLKLTMLSNRMDRTAANDYLALTRLSVPTADREGGIVSLPVGLPVAQFVAASSSAAVSSSVYDGAPLLGANTHVWRSETGQASEAWYRFELGGEGAHTIDRVRVRATTAQQSVAGFSVHTSVSGDPGDFTPALGVVEVERVNDWFEFELDAPVDARFVELRDLRNHSGTYVQLAGVEVRTVDGLNVADGARVGGAVVGFSAQANDSSYAAANVLEHGVSNTWRSGAGNAEDQALTVLLRGGDTHVVDRVLLSSNAGLPTGAEVWVSTTGQADADFTRVASVSDLPNVANLDHWIVFAPVAAKLVQVRLPASHGSNYIGLTQLRVFSPERGGAADVPFIDLSRSPADITAWAWDFGDGTTSTEPYPRHTFPGPGTYAVTLTVTDTAGDTATTSGTYTVPATASPAVVLSSPATTPLDEPWVVEEGRAGNVSASLPGDLGAVEWQVDYDWRATTTSTTPTASFNISFPNDGATAFTVRALTADYLWTSARHEVTVTNVAPTVTPGAAVSGYAGNPLTPQASASDPVDALTCRWDWGDGSTTDVTGNCRTASVVRVPHTYALPGEYTATLTVDDGDGGVSSGSVTMTALHRPSYIQVLDAAPVGDDLRVTARLMDGLTSAPVGAQPVAIAADGGAALASTTGEDGTVTVVLPGARGASDVVLDFAGSALHEASTLARAVDVPAADIVFIIDESASMSSYQVAVLERIREISQGLGAHLDYRLGLAGYAGGYTSGFGHVISPLTQDMTDYTAALGELRISSANANGYDGVVTGLGEEMGFRPAAATCAVLISDAAASEIASSSPTTTKEEAIAALGERGTALFAVTVQDAATLAAYGPDGGLSDVSGGDWWFISDFTRDASAVLQALVGGCVDVASTPELALTKTASADVVGPDEELTYSLAVRNEGAITVGGITVTDPLPEGVAFVSATAGGVYDEGDHTVTWVAPALSATEEAVLTVTVRAPGRGELGVGEHELVNTASVAGDPALGEERDLTNNVSTVTVVVEVEALPDPDPTETPDPDPTETPDPDPTETPDPDPTETPDPDPTETPDPDPTETPDPDPTETPDPAPGPTETPDPDPTETPGPDPTETPDPTPSPTVPGPTDPASPSPTGGALPTDTAPGEDPAPPALGGTLPDSGAPTALLALVAVLLLATGGALALRRQAHP